MFPASIAGIIFLTALVPGFVFLYLTSRHRHANHNPSAIEEAVTFVAVGLAIAGPVFATASLIFADTLASLARAFAKPATVTESDVRIGTLLALLVEGAAVAVAWRAAVLYRKRNPVRSGESAWRDVLGAKTGKGILTVANVTMKDHTVVQGIVYSHDGIALGAGRDIALQPPLTVIEIEKQPRRLDPDVDRILLSETEIHSILVTYDDPDARPAS